MICSLLLPLVPSYVSMFRPPDLPAGNRFGPPNRPNRLFSTYEQAFITGNVRRIQYLCSCYPLPIRTSDGGCWLRKSVCGCIIWRFPKKSKIDYLIAPAVDFPHPIVEWREATVFCSRRGSPKKQRATVRKCVDGIIWSIFPIVRRYALFKCSLMFWKRCSSADLHRRKPNHDEARKPIRKQH